MRPSSSSSDDPGERTRREVLGDAHVDRAQASTSDFTRPFQAFISRYAWGDVWNRPGLDRRQRSMITLAAVTALGAEKEIELHVRGALNNGLAPEEIAEVLLHTAVYAGLPRGNAAFAVAQRVLEE
jgi:4-carboxymuconolactone decarboxylase